MNTLLWRADAVLRGKPQTTRAEPVPHLLWQLAGCVLFFGALYGAAMGCRGLWPGGSMSHAPADRCWMVLYGAIKVPCLLLATFALSVPSFFVLNTLWGVRGDFGEALQGLLATQAGLAVILAALAPFTLFWYASSSSYNGAILFNAVMFAVASISSQYLLRRYYRPLIARSEQHRWLLRLWLVLYGFVGIQMGWLLRPFIGDPSSPATFLRADSWSNAYIVLSSMVLRLLH